MSNQALFYEQAVPLSRERHAGWSVDPQAGFAFSRHTNAVPLAAVEFLKTAREYPIVFLQEGESTVPVAVLGLKDRQNLYISRDGSWNAEYIPAFVRRYPFIFARHDDGQNFTVFIDESFVGCNQEAKGEALFTADGEQSDYLKQVVGFLQEYQRQHERTRELCERVRALDLLEPVQANVEIKGGDKMSLAGFHVASRARLNALSGEQLAGLAKDGSLELLYSHLFSMDSFSRLLERFAGSA